MLMASLFTTLLASLLTTSDILSHSERFDHLYTSLLLINAIAVLTLVGLIGLNLHHLIYQVRRGRAGARLTVRLVTLLVILSIIPVTIVYYFSLQFLHQRLDNWFDFNVEQALDSALSLSRITLEDRMRDALQQTEKAANLITNHSEESLVSKLNDLLNNSQAIELTVFAKNGQIIATSSTDFQHLLPPRPDENALLRLKSASRYIGIESIKDRGLYVRVIIKITTTTQLYLLQALHPISEQVVELAGKVSSAINEYKEKAYLNQPLKQNFTLVLSLTLIITILSAIWLAFFSARRIVSPLSDLVEGTEAVASGDYEKQIPVGQSDELGFLVHSFNEMTRKIAQARDEVEQSQQLADRERRYLEAVLERLSSGVITLDEQQRLRTVNPAAAHIFELSLTDLVGYHFFELQENYSFLQTLYTVIAPHLLDNEQDWHEEVTLFTNTGRKILMCRGTQLREAVSLYVSDALQHGGYVVVFDDITTFVQAQRDAAWTEVARRLAHEIKNPLTPIQLSAERLRSKYLVADKPPNTDLLDRMTHTIIQQVEAMKEMVNAFSDYAKTPVMHWQNLSLNELIKEILELYYHIDFRLSLDNNLPTISADKSRLRQLLHNLLKNAIEANPIEQTITITTQYLTEPHLNCIELRVQDQGSGIPLQLMDKIFEPYVTTKNKGTGLGLAIVKKIVEEHGGMVWIENIAGACIIIRLPLNLKTSHEQTTTA